MGDNVEGAGTGLAGTPRAGTDTAPSAAGTAGSGGNAEVGRVAGTMDSTPLLFRVALREDAYLQLDDVVMTVRDVPGLGTVTTSGVVTEVTARHEGAAFGSDVFLISEGVLPAHVQEIAEVTTTRVDPECYVPPRPGVVASRAHGADREKALYFDQMDAKVPIGLGRDGEPIYLNLEFLDGTRGAPRPVSVHAMPAIHTTAVTGTARSAQRIPATIAPPVSASRIASPFTTPSATEAT